MRRQFSGFPSGAESGEALAGEGVAPYPAAEFSVTDEELVQLRELRDLVDASLAGDFGHNYGRNPDYVYVKPGSGEVVAEYIAVYPRTTDYRHRMFFADEPTARMIGDKADQLVRSRMPELDDPYVRNSGLLTGYLRLPTFPTASDRTFTLFAQYRPYRGNSRIPYPLGFSERLDLDGRAR